MVIGNRYYKWVNPDTDNEYIEEIRIVGIKKDGTYKAKLLKPEPKEENITVTDSDLEEYTKLSPDGYVNFNIVADGKNVRDVMVTLSRKKDVEQGDPVPHLVCRQCVNDIFAAQTEKITKEYFGLSISKDTCPANVEFQNFLACNGVEQSNCVAFYIGDTFNNVLGLIRTRDYDIALYNLFSDRCKFVSNNIKYIYNQKMNGRYIDGYCKTLKDLLTVNNFQYDLMQAYGIIPMDLDLAMCVGSALDPVALEQLKGLLCKNIDKSIVIKYDKSIDLSKIERNYQLVSDASDTVYVVGYTYNGEYHIPVEDVESADNITKLSNLTRGNLKSIQDIYSNLSFDTSKYE